MSFLPFTSQRHTYSELTLQEDTLSLTHAFHGPHLCNLQKQIVITKLTQYVPNLIYDHHTPPPHTHNPFRASLVMACQKSQDSRQNSGCILDSQVLTATSGHSETNSVGSFNVYEKSNYFLPCLLLLFKDKPSPL